MPRHLSTDKNQWRLLQQVITGQLLTEGLSSSEKDNNDRLAALYPGQTRWAGIRTLRNINPL